MAADWFVFSTLWVQPEEEKYFDSTKDNFSFSRGEREKDSFPF